MNKLLLTVFIFGLTFLAESQHKHESPDKINGMSFVAVNHAIDSTHVVPMKSLGVGWVAIIPFAYMPAATMPEIRYDKKWQWRGERIEGSRQHIRQMHAQNLSVMMKPQIWIGHGTYTGEIEMMNNKDWRKLEDNYTKYILAYASIANEENVEMLCVGTELKLFVATRPDYWSKLIKEIKKIYSGKLTYAANWDDFDDATFWGDLDYIGVDAYFPISQEGKRKLSDLKNGWKQHLALLDTVSNLYDKKILFTEYGYRSIKDCAAKPWDYSEDAAVDLKAQCLALEALYQSVWKEEKFAGGFLWKWHADNENAGGKENNMFTVQNKEALNVVMKYYN